MPPKSNASRANTPKDRTSNPRPKLRDEKRQDSHDRVATVGDRAGDSSVDADTVVDEDTLMEGAEDTVEEQDSENGKGEHDNARADIDMNIDGGDDGEVLISADNNDDTNDLASAAAAAPPPLPPLTRDQQLAKTLASIDKNWGFSSVVSCIPDDTWLKRELKNMTDDKWEVATLVEFQELADETAKQGTEIKEQIRLHWRKRGSIGGADRSIGDTKARKERNIREDLKRIRNGDWVTIKPHKKKTEELGDNEEVPVLPGRMRTRGAAATVSKGTPGPGGKNTPAKRKPIALEEEDDDEYTSSAPVKKQKSSNRRPVTKAKVKTEGNTEHKGKREAPASIHFTDRLQASAEISDALKLIYQNWLTNSLLGSGGLGGFLPKGLLSDNVENDMKIPKEILAALVDLSNLTKTKERIDKVREDLENKMNSLAGRNVDDIIEYLARIREPFNTVAEDIARQDTGVITQVDDPMVGIAPERTGRTHEPRADKATASQPLVENIVPSSKAPASTLGVSTVAHSRSMAVAELSKYAGEAQQTMSATAIQGANVMPTPGPSSNTAYPLLQSPIRPEGEELSRLENNEQNLNARPRLREVEEQQRRLDHRRELDQHRYQSAVLDIDAFRIRAERLQVEVELEEKVMQEGSGGQGDIRGDENGD